MHHQVRQPSDHRRIEISTISIHIILGAEHTGAALEAFEFTAPAGSPGPTMHTHATATETFYVLEGSLLVHAGGSSALVHAGGVANIPPGVPHRFEYPGPGPTRFLTTFTPAIGMERYFHELRELFVQGWPPRPEAMAALLARHDIHPA